MMIVIFIIGHDGKIRDRQHPLGLQLVHETAKIMITAPGPDHDRTAMYFPSLFLKRLFLYPYPA